ncbi:MAG: DUF3887 domain-containing protein [Candidatus Methanomethylicaceae archaeon]
MTRKNVFLVLVALMVLAAGTYILSLPPGIDEKRVKAYADIITEDVLIAMDEGNYTKFSKDFDSTMKSAMTEAVFNQTASMIRSKVGNYLSKEIWKVEVQGNYTVVYYKARYTEEGEVLVKIVFTEAGERHYVSGLWFDSPKLRS